MIDVVAMPTQVTNEANKGLGIISTIMGYSSYNLVVPFPNEESRLLAVIKPFQAMVKIYKTMEKNKIP